MARVWIPGYFRTNGVTGNVETVSGYWRKIESMNPDDLPWKSAPFSRDGTEEIRAGHTVYQIRPDRVGGFYSGFEVFRMNENFSDVEEHMGSFGSRDSANQLVYEDILSGGALTPPSPPTPANSYYDPEHYDADSYIPDWRSLPQYQRVGYQPSIDRQGAPITIMSRPVKPGAVDRLLKLAKKK